MAKVWQICLFRQTLFIQSLLRISDDYIKFAKLLCLVMRFHQTLAMPNFHRLLYTVSSCRVQMAMGGT